MFVSQHFVCCIVKILLLNMFVRTLESSGSLLAGSFTTSSASSLKVTSVSPKFCSLGAENTEETQGKSFKLEVNYAKLCYTMLNYETILADLNIRLNYAKPC